MTSTAESAALAGLVHDIGKFWQRCIDDNVHLDFSSVSSEGDVTFSTAFVKQFIPERWQQDLLSGVLWQQRPQDRLSRLIALANQLSSVPDHEQAVDPTNPPALQTIFSHLGTSTDSAFVPLRELELTESALIPNRIASRSRQSDYKDLWSAFQREAEGLATITSLSAYLEGMLALFQRYTWCVPLADSSGISLYDHSRTVAAVAACLSAFDDAVIHALLMSPSEQPIITVLEGDLSGIQRFLYTVPARGAVKQLRARSLYLQLLTDASARWLLRNAGMPVVNLIYSGGGRFFALLPHADNSEEWLTQMQQALDELLLKHHDGDLYLSLGWTHLTMQDFTSAERFSGQWQAVTAATNAAKRARYRTFSSDRLFDTVFEPRWHGEDDELWLRRSERDEVDADQEDGRRAVSALGQSFEDFSRRLAHADALLLTVVPFTPGEPAGFETTLRELGLEVEPLNTGALGRSRVEAPVHADAEYAVLQGLRSAPGEQALNYLRRERGRELVGALRFTVNVTPMLNQGEQPATFDLLQEAAAVNGAIKRLGVLRMDVDDLGAVFASGFRDPNIGASRASLERVAGLSFALGLFFEGWVGELCTRVNRERVVEIPSDKHGQPDRVEAVYAVYSGGDDLFIVGRWDVLPGLAHEIQRDLRRYAAGTSQIHLSAGITLHGGKYPLYQAAEEAKDALDQAKALEGKDAITFLGQSVKWSQWDELTARRDELHTLITVNNVPRGLLQLLLQLHEDYVTAVRAASLNKAGEVQIVWGPWQWRSAYQFAQLAERSKSNKAAIESLYAGLQQSNFEGIMTMGMAARWVEALIRGVARSRYKEEA